MTNIPRVCRIIGGGPWIFCAIADRATAVLARAGIRREAVIKRQCRDIPASDRSACMSRHLLDNGQRRALPGAARSIAMDRERLIPIRLNRRTVIWKNSRNSTVPFLTDSTVENRNFENLTVFFCQTVR